ncbi:MAG: hypothetical protein KAQ98_05330 [Bacteriovoracaceae bacterium]|nr:hypothetical protein [Bacteriovoracaceae bacterium]
MSTSTIKKDSIIIVIFFAILIIINGILLGTGSLKWGWDGIGIMVAAALTIALYSFLYKDNPIFKIAEHLYVGLATAYLFIVTWYNVILPDVIFAFRDLGNETSNWAILGKTISVSIPTILGLLVYTRLVPKFSWLSRITFAALIGFGAGFTIPNYINSHILKQAQPTMVALWGAGGIQWGALLIFIVVISTLVYFFFSVEHKGPVGWTAKLGIWFLMVSFGASFGYTVMARISLLIGRVNFLFSDWIPLIK